jgi:hypothetical protein
MQTDLGRRLDEMDARKDVLLGGLSATSAERLVFRPGGTGWCALDVVQHVVLVEEGVVAYVRRKLEAPPRAVGPFHGVKRLLLVLVLKSPLRFRAPVPQVVPAETLPIAEIAPRWERVRGNLRETLAGLGEERLRAMLFRHPAAGPLDAAGTLDFLDEHAKHHDAQIRRIWRSSGCPA